MNPRYQIEEIANQDETGVVFRGVDGETGAAVAVRRFFPFGAQGGGLEDEEREAYAEAVATLGRLRHASLRAVLDGGCDPVDGLPYLVTEWLEGMTLGEMIERDGPLRPSAAVAAVAMLFEAGAVLSSTFGREALWVEAAPEAVGVIETGAGWHLSFRISPWQWLGVDDGGKDLDAAADFAEYLVGWTGKVVADAAGSGLGGWIRRVRQREFEDLNAASAGLTVLAAAMEAEIDGGMPGPGPVRPTPTPTPTARPTPLAGSTRSNPLPLVAIAILTLAVAGLGAWVMFGRGDPGDRAQAAADGKAGDKAAAPDPVAASSSEAPPPPAVEAARPPIAETADPAPAALAAPVRPRNAEQARVDELMARIHGDRGAIDERRQRVARDGFYGIEDGDLLLEQAGKAEVVLRGRLARVRFSASRITMYLEFSEDAPHHEPRAYAMARDLVDGIRPEDLEPLVGRMLEIRGPVNAERIISPNSPRGEVVRGRVQVAGREAITVLADDDGS